MTIQSQSVSVPAVFSFEANRPLRVVERDGNPWFVAKDVCIALGLEWKGSDSTGSLGNLDDDERGSVKVDTIGGTLGMFGFPTAGKGCQKFSYEPGSDEKGMESC